MGTTRSADRANRIVMGLVGAAVLGGAAAGLVRSYGEPFQDEPILPGDARARLDDPDLLAASAVMVAAVIVAVLALAWLRHQVRPAPRAREVMVTRTASGTTVVKASALTDAIEADLTGLAGVRNASARIRTSDPDTVDVVLDVGPQARLRHIVDEARARVLAPARTATGQSLLALDVECRPVPADQTRVE